MKSNNAKYFHLAVTSSKFAKPPNVNELFQVIILQLNFIHCANYVTFIFSFLQVVLVHSSLHILTVVVFGLLQYKLMGFTVRGLDTAFPLGGQNGCLHLYFNFSNFHCLKTLNSLHVKVKGLCLYFRILPSMYYLQEYKKTVPPPVDSCTVFIV